MAAMYFGESNMAPELVANASFGLPAYVFPPAAAAERGQQWRAVVKRVFDLALSLLLLVAIASWLFPVIAALIRLDSRGPVFFRQARIGLNGRTFMVWKFRTMHMHRE